jgi:hypothetical protein
MTEHKPLPPVASPAPAPEDRPPEAPPADRPPAPAPADGLARTPTAPADRIPRTTDEPAAPASPGSRTGDHPAGAPTEPGGSRSGDGPADEVPAPAARPDGSTHRRRLPRGGVLAIGLVLGAAAAVLVRVAAPSSDTGQGPGTGGGADAGAAATSGFATDGTFTLPGPHTDFVPGAPCSGSGRDAELDVGARVEVTDAKGNVVASGSLDQGEQTAGGCQFFFTVWNVPPGSPYYAIEVAGRGGGRPLSEAELRAGRLLLPADG